MDIAFRILDEQQKVKDRNLKREKKRRKMHDLDMSMSSISEDDDIDSFAVIS